MPSRYVADLREHRPSQRRLVDGRPNMGSFWVAAKRNGSIAVRHQFGGVGVTFSGETGDVWQDGTTSATGSPYRFTSIAVDRSFGRNWISAGMSRLEEKQSLLGGRMCKVLGGGGSTSPVPRRRGAARVRQRLERRPDRAARLDRFAAGKFQTGAYAFDLAKIGVLGEQRPAGLPLRAAAAGRAWRVRDVAADLLRLCDRDRDQHASAACR